MGLTIRPSNSNEFDNYVDLLQDCDVKFPDERFVEDAIPQRPISMNMRKERFPKYGVKSSISEEFALFLQIS